MDVSKLSEVELSRAMIWCYPPEHRDHDPFRDNGKWCHSGTYEDTINYDYLDDWNLTMPLAVENHLDMDFDGKMWRIYGPSASYSKHKILIRAICETLVLIALERK